MQTTKTTLQDELELFRLKYGSPRVMVYKDCLVYKVSAGWGRKAATRANDLIKINNWNLKAESSGLPDDSSFCIKSK